MNSACHEVVHIYPPARRRDYHALISLSVMRVMLLSSVENTRN